MLSVNSVSKSFADQTILKDISFVVSPDERVGLIGPNGSGKTTLLRLIADEEQPDRGSVFIDPHTRVGYLRQGLAYPIGCTVADVLHDPRVDAAAEVERLAMASSFDPLRLHDYQAALDRLEALGGYPDQAARDNVLQNLGLDQVPLSQEVATLSGGQKTRLGLAKVLLNAPNLLLLDEPTNHLDLPMLEWLEQWLSHFKGAVLLVSHDRVFLDRAINRVVYLDPQTHTARGYAGNYTAYLEQSLAEHERHWDAYKQQEAEIRRMKQDIAQTMEQSRSVERSTTPRQPNVRRLAKKVAKKAKSREKKLDRYLEADERVEKPKQGWQMKVDFGDLPESGKDVLRLEKLSVGYGDQVLLQEVSLSIRQGERIALIGENGTGKSTLVKTIVGQVSPLSGDVRLGANVRMGYFAQEQDTLDPNSTPVASLRAVAVLNETEARSFLHFFLFTGDQPLTPNRSLSYGERARLMLALLVAQGSNFLILDEPLNHLDIPSRTQFEKALTNFEGTVLAVVHDRYFIQGFASRIWAVERQQVKEYLELEDVNPPGGSQPPGGSAE
ncbi:MAG: ABC-F family ATP-binding cassette domain-containing protein [Chloroflexi bacterium]|nr:ABC-F family ATP-binding cassette domain-containing protein [Chloroflexota bacterium]